MPSHRKRVKHYHEPGDLHELTFSCYQRQPLLTNGDGWRQLCVAIDRAVPPYSLRLVAFVLMPAHAHLLVYPTVPKPKIDRFLSAVKRPHSFRMKQWLAQNDVELLQRLTVRERPGKMVFRFWQEGAGYDRRVPLLSRFGSAVLFTEPGG